MDVHGDPYFPAQGDALARENQEPSGNLWEILAEILKDKPWENAVSTVETRRYWRRNLVETSGRSRPQSRAQVVAPPPVRVSGGRLTERTDPLNAAQGGEFTQSRGQQD